MRRRQIRQQLREAKAMPIESITARRHAPECALCRLRTATERHGAWAVCAECARQLEAGQVKR